MVFDFFKKDDKADPDAADAAGDDAPADQTANPAEAQAPNVMTSKDP